MMVTKVQKRGLRISKQVLDLADIAVGDNVQIIVGDGQITVSKAAFKYGLAQLVARIPKRHRAKESGFGPPVGKEEW